MLEEYELKTNSLDTLTIPQVVHKINVKDNDTAKKWLSDRNIPIYKWSSQPFVYQIEVDCEIDKPYVMTLRNKHPQQWKEIYRSVVKDMAVYNLQLIQLNQQPTPTPTTSVKPLDKNDEKIYKDLLG
jgi:hypothetical protein